MRGLVAAAAAGEDGDGALRRLGQRLADEHVLVAEDRDMRRLSRDAFQHFSDDIGRAVDKLFHGDGFRTGERGTAGPARAPDGLSCCGGSCVRPVAGPGRSCNGRPDAGGERGARLAPRYIRFGPCRANRGAKRAERGGGVLPCAATSLPRSPSRESAWRAARCG
ncbi:hypothetical protein BCEP4_1410002 [Burkholderia cepacia]|nr:hypothetical protein BCEP4_1410002 [Burkholderia cepacia]